MSPNLPHDAQRKLSAVESFKRRFFTKSNLSMGIGWLVFLMLVFWASKYGGSETPFFDPYEILQVGHISPFVRCYNSSYSAAKALPAGWCLHALQPSAAETMQNSEECALDAREGLACTHFPVSIGASIAWCCRWGQESNT